MSALARISRGYSFYSFLHRKARNATRDEVMPTTHEDMPDGVLHQHAHRTGARIDVEYGRASVVVLPVVKVLVVTRRTRLEYERIKQSAYEIVVGDENELLVGAQRGGKGWSSQRRSRLDSLL